MGIPAKAAFSVIAPPERPAPGAPGPFSLGDPQHLESLLSQAGFKNIVLDPCERPLNVGSVDGAMHWFTQMGPAATPLSEASDDDRAAAEGAMRAALEAHATSDGVILDSATWIARASL